MSTTKSHFILLRNFRGEVATATVPVVFFEMGQISKLKGKITPRNLSNLVCLHVFMQIKKNQKGDVIFDYNILCKGCLKHIHHLRPFIEHYMR